VAAAYAAVEQAGGGGARSRRGDDKDARRKSSVQTQIQVHLDAKTSTKTHADAAIYSTADAADLLTHDI
jgi:hypothetical protein